MAKASSSHSRDTTAAVSESASKPQDARGLPLVILGLDLKLLCRQCGTKLIIDVSWQGRELNCPHCGMGAVVPQYSDLLIPADASRKAASIASSEAALSPLSDAEIAFLSEPGKTVPRVAEPGTPRLAGVPAPESAHGRSVCAVLPDDAKRAAALASRDA